MKDGNMNTGTDILAIMNNHSACVIIKFDICHPNFATTSLK